MPDPDSRLIRKAKQGNERAFKKLVGKYELKVLYLAFDILGNYEDAKDLAQEVFIRVFDKFHTFQARSRFSTWLYRITVNMATDYLRKTNKTQLQSLDGDHGEMENQMTSDRVEMITETELKIEQKELNGLLRSALDKISTNQRTAVILRYFHQKSSHEIAEILECDVNTVRTHIFRGLKKLKNHVSELRD